MAIFQNTYPLYCNICGAKLIYREKGYDFDPQTGVARKKKVTTYCPILVDENEHNIDILLRMGHTFETKIVRK